MYEWDKHLLDSFELSLQLEGFYVDDIQMDGNECRFFVHGHSMHAYPCFIVAVSEETGKKRCFVEWDEAEERGRWFDYYGDERKTEEEIEGFREKIDETLRHLKLTWKDHIQLVKQGYDFDEASRFSYARQHQNAAPGELVVDPYDGSVYQKMSQPGPRGGIHAWDF